MLIWEGGGGDLIEDLRKPNLFIALDIIIASCCLLKRKSIILELFYVPHVPISQQYDTNETVSQDASDN